MKRLLWIAEDLLRDGGLRSLLPGALLLSILLPLQAGWCEATLEPLAWPWSRLALSRSIGWAGSGPLIVAVLLPYRLMIRRLERRIEPWLLAPATASQLVTGAALPGVAAAAGLAPLAWLSTGVGAALKSGRLPPMPLSDGLAWMGELAIAAALLSACALHGALASRSPAGAAAALAPGLAAILLLDAAGLARAAVELGRLPPLAALAAAAASAVATAIARFDRGRILIGLR